MKRWAKILLALVALLLGGILVAGWVVHRPLPQGQPGREADALARRIQEAVHLEGWERTGAVRWTFAGRHDLLWDRKGNRARVRWNDTEVLLRLGDRTGVATVEGEPATGEAKAGLLEEAYAHFINDAFWLYPFRTFFDDGVRREVVELEDGGRGLLVTYTSGGVTPGDSYLWIPGPDGKPESWRMWVSILPVGGIETSWEGWQPLATGALVATRHAAGPLTLELDGVDGAETLARLVGEDDPFAALER